MPHSSSLVPKVESEGWLFAAGLFVVTSVWYVRHLKHQSSQSPYNAQGPYGHWYRRLPRHDPEPHVYDPQEPHKGVVGSRGEAALAPPIPYLKQFLVCLHVRIMI
jgi:hypothetical protein